MPRVDFYILTTPSKQDTLRLACRLAEKAWRMGHRVYVATDSADAARKVDAFMWTFRPDSFVPHGRYPEDADGEFPILVGHAKTPQEWGEVLINLTHSIPDLHQSFRRVAEFVSDDDESRRLGRDRYRYYRDQGYDVDSHRL